MAFTVIIPARQASTRLPGKMLADIGGKPMIVRVAELAQRSDAQAVFVATDHNDIAKAVETHGFQTVMTSPECPSGTDRLAEAAAKLALAPNEVIVNVQGDEPLLPVGIINACGNYLSEHAERQVATAAVPIENYQDWLNPMVVKAVCDLHGDALYFSRAPIPFARDDFLWDESNKSLTLKNAKTPKGVLRHLGIYAYRAQFLALHCQRQPSFLEKTEMLEQLRIQEHGHKIRVLVEQCLSQSVGVDTAEDLEKVRAIWRQKASNGS